MCLRLRKVVSGGYLGDSRWQLFVFGVEKGGGRVAFKLIRDDISAGKED